MVMNYVIWSSIISLAAIMFLYPLRTSRGGWVSQFYASLLLFPALVSSFYLCELVYKNKIIINKINSVPMTKLFFGIHIDDFNSIILVSLNLMFIIIIFSLPRKKIDDNISLLSLSFLLLSIITLVPDHFIRLFAFSFGSILITHAIISKEDNEYEINYLTKLCMLNITSDFLAFIALLCVLIEQNNLLVYKLMLSEAHIEDFPRVLCFFSIVMRLISLLAVVKPAILPVHTTIQNLVLNAMVTGVGSQIMLIHFSHIIFTKGRINIFFLLGASGILFYSLLILISDRKKNNFPYHLSTFFISCIFLIICAGYYFIAVLLICIALFAFPIIIMPATIKTQVYGAVGLPQALPKTPGPTAQEKREQTADVDRLAEPNLLIIFLEILFFRLPKKIINLFTNLLIRFLYPIYAGFLLYRLPQLVLGIIQTPLRILNNGNIERSLIFVLFLVASYIYWWGGLRE